jgi:hypothetical protein
MIERLFIIGVSILIVIAIIVLVGAAILATRTKGKLDAS